MNQQRVTFIGAGNMSEALLAGLIAGGHQPEKVTVTDVAQARLDVLCEQYGVMTNSNNMEAVSAADVLVLSVKPQKMAEVLSEIGSAITESTTVVSIAAGVCIDNIHAFAKRDDLSIVRVMPNTPALVGAGMSVLFSDADQQHKDRAEYVLAASGETAWVDAERHLHAVTAVSGSGPAYFFLLAETMQAAGEALGLSKELAARLANQTAMGAGRMLAESGRSAATLRSQVTSPGGTTQAALDMLYECELPLAVRKATQAASKRSKELS